MQKKMCCREATAARTEGIAMQQDAKVTAWISTQTRGILGLNPPEQGAKFNDR